MFRRLAPLAVVVGILSLASAASAAETLSFVDLANRMIDLERLSVLPADGERCVQWSSYDRASKYDEATGKYVGWSANGDGNGIICKEGDREVLAEMDGPGCIWRIWSARAQQGHVRIFLDGREQPAVDLPFIEYFDAKHEPFTYPLLSYEMKNLGNRGENLYFPISYQKSCKIVADKGWGQYFQFVYTTYPKGTQVPSFTGTLTADEKAAVKRVNDFFQDKLGSDPAGERPGQKAVVKSLALPAGKATTAATLEGPLAITSIKMKARFGDRDDECVALRKTAIKITFDGQSQPAVWCPLGDFFGTAPGVNLYKSLMTGMTDEGCYAYWYMPFGKSAVVELVNDDKEERNIVFAIRTAPLKRPMEQLGYFHCKWHRDVFPLSRDRQPDWTMLKTTGRGRFCGVMLHVWNPRGSWWGEGDEKFFVDGEKFPSTIGTGSEDYFGYAWCHPGLFQRPYHCQTMTQNNAGHQSVLRWHVGDNVPFASSFEGCIEKYYPNEKPTLYACTVCWYLAAGGDDPFGPLPAADRWGYCTIPPMDGGLKVLGKPKGSVEVQSMAHFGEGKWKNNDQIWWTRAQPGDKLDIAFPVEKAGTCQVEVTLTKARDYGIVQFSLDGRKVGESVDLYNATVIPTGPVSLGKHELTAGEHKLTIKIVGANEQAVKAYMFGLDRVITTPAK